MPSTMAWNRYSVAEPHQAPHVVGHAPRSPDVSSLPSTLRQKRRAFVAERMEQARPHWPRACRSTAVLAPTANFNFVAHDRLEAPGHSSPSAWSERAIVRRRTAIAISSRYSALKLRFSSACRSAWSDCAISAFDARRGVAMGGDGGGGGARQRGDDRGTAGAAAPAQRRRSSPAAGAISSRDRRELQREVESRRTQRPRGRPRPR